MQGFYSNCEITPSSYFRKFLRLSAHFGLEIRYLIYFGLNSSLLVPSDLVYLQKVPEMKELYFTPEEKSIIFPNLLDVFRLLGMERYFELFEKHGIDLEVLKEWDHVTFEDNLQKMRIGVGFRTKLWRHFHSMVDI